MLEARAMDPATVRALVNAVLNGDLKRAQQLARELLAA